MPRIVSLVPNATEILFALGAGAWVVGRSHECDWPPEARGLPILTGSALKTSLSDAAVDAAVSAQLAAGDSLYTLDDEALARLAPDLIFTQELCPVCAVSTVQVGGATVRLEACPEVVSLDPRTLADVFADIARVGERLGLGARARALVASLERRLDAVRAGVRNSTTVAALEWLDPPFTAGHWVPEMIAIAGGRDLFGVPGGRSERTDWGAIASADPDVIVAMPCGYDADGAARVMAGLATDPRWGRLRAVRTGRAVAVDANGLFSRPGPRLVDGVERLAAILQVD